MNLLVMKKSSGIEAEPKHLAYASYCLNVRVSTLKMFLKREVSIIPNETVRDLISKHPSPIKMNKHLVEWEDKFLLYDNYSEVDWKVVLLLYIIYNSLNKYKAYTDVNIYIYETLMNMSNRHAIMDNMLKQLAKESATIKTLNYFNYKGIIKQCRALKLRCSIKGENLMIHLGSIILSNGNISIDYKDIIVVLKEHKIDGFILRFKDFDYSSYWGMYLTLHPNLSVPYCHNRILEWYTPSNFIKGIYDACTEVGSNGLVRMDNLQNTLNEYKVLWKGLKLNGNRRSNSKQLFETNI